VASSHNALFEAVFEALPCEIVVHDGVHVVLANAAACRAVGAISPRSLVGLPLSALIGPAENASTDVGRLLRAGQTAPYLPLALSITDLTGDTFPLEATVRGFSVGDRRYAVIARCRFYPELATPAVDSPEFAEGTALARATLDAMLQPVTVYDEDDRFLYSNTAAQELFVGEATPELAGHPVSAVIHPVAHEAARERRKLVLDTGQSFLQIEAKLQRLDGGALHAIGSLGSARLPSGARVGYWIGHTVGNGRGAAVTA
jgi:PAS domain S-box-containing protein